MPAIAIMLICAALVCAAIPLLAHQLSVSRQEKCIRKLRQIDGAKLMWAMEHHADPNVVPTWEFIRPYGGRCECQEWYLHFPPQCPSGGTYTIGRIADHPTCTFPGHALP